MIEFVRTAVLRNPSLGLKKTQKEHRVMKSGLKGSLWIGTRYEGYRLQTTGSAAYVLNKEIERIAGNPIGEQKGYKFWYVDDISIVEQIIEFFGQV